MEAASMEARIIELESKLSFAEDLIDELNRGQFRQQEQLEHMQLQMMLLHQQLQSLTKEDARDPRDELPPHY